MINLGLVSIDASGTLDRKIFQGTEGIGGGMTYQDLNANLAAMRPTTTEGTPCPATNPFCWAQILGQAAGEFTAWLGFASRTALFFISYLPTLIFGYHEVLMLIANELEASALGPIHLLLTGLSGVIFIMLVYGLWGVIRWIASIVPGVGGS